MVIYVRRSQCLCAQRVSGSRLALHKSFIFLVSVRIVQDVAREYAREVDLCIWTMHSLLGGDYFHPRGLLVAYFLGVLAPLSCDYEGIVSSALLHIFRPYLKHRYHDL